MSNKKNYILNQIKKPNFCCFFFFLKIFEFYFCPGIYASPVRTLTLIGYNSFQIIAQLNSEETEAVLQDNLEMTQIQSKEINTEEEE